jgi:hypothetical protein
MTHLKTVQYDADLLKEGDFEKRERWDNIKIEDCGLVECNSA